MLADPANGLIPDGRFGSAELATLVSLRNRYRLDGHFLSPERVLKSGLVDERLLQG